MNQETFLKRLEELLSDISEDERAEAMEYYRCYFEDAGEENEAAVLAELGTPEKVAATIQADLKGESVDSGFTERGYEEFGEKDVPVTKEQIFQEEKEYQQAGAADPAERKSDSTWIAWTPLRILAVILMGIAVVAVAAVLVGVAIGLFSATAAVGGIGVGFIGVAIGMLASGAPAIACGMLCGGAICLAIFFLLLLASVAFCVNALPPVIRAMCEATAAVCRGRRE